MSIQETDKAVILARGLGTRMRKSDADAPLDARQAAVAETGVKALIPIDRPFLDYVLHVVAQAGRHERHGRERADYPVEVLLLEASREQERPHRSGGVFDD